MLLSMTGQGEARASYEAAEVSIEMRTVNSRFLKVSVRTNEGLAALESRIEETIRQSVRRGTVQLNLRMAFIGRNDYELNLERVQAYRDQLVSLAAMDAVESPQAAAPRVEIPWAAILLLPGVVDEPRQEQDIEQNWQLVAPVLKEALGRLDEMRRREGEAMRLDLSSNIDAIANELESVKKRAPEVVANYQRRIVDRLNSLLENQSVEVEPADVVREVGIFSERCDISEEIVRLDSHLQQYRSIIDEPTSSGRKLDFLTQELNREVNTIGSKANDAELSRHVVEMKTLIERMREMIQNVE
jgi:uncharacterized protein (TIGR00255 family)